MLEVGTFSALVDQTIETTGRPEPELVAGYARSTLRECQILSLFAKDRLEVSFTEDTFTLPVNWRKLETLRYSMYDSGTNGFLYAPILSPGSFFESKTYAAYVSGNFLHCKGFNGGKKDLAYFTYFPFYTYFAAQDQRPAMFSADTQSWSYAANLSQADFESARIAVSNWLLFNWFDLIKTGTEAKVFAQYGSDRARVIFARYKQQQKDLIHAETLVSV